MFCVHLIIYKIVIWLHLKLKLTVRYFTTTFCPTIISIPLLRTLHIYILLNASDITDKYTASNNIEKYSQECLKPVMKGD